jgi:hypothetical protein
MVSTRDLIRQLGGPGSVARACGVSAPAVSNWIARDGIPVERHIPLWRLALQLGVEWTPPGADGCRLVEGEAA